ncbi:GumC family protein [Haloferula sargassicola]|uniref:Uncharacterized protein n=1 Tax=Haloferula sargassicola TaxID=490096 RepID=A0ABP9UPT6_9BACT
MSSPGSSTTPATEPDPTAVSGGKRFGYPVAIDPVRLLAGILARWPWILVGVLVFGGLGFIAGKLITHQTFSLSVALIKRRVPQTVQTSEIGQSFRPADLNDATLLATLLASEPLDLALKEANNGISSGHVSTFVEASQQENTDIFYITYHSPVSAEDAVRFTGIWAEQIREYTKRLQQAEARGVLELLAKEVAELEQQIEDTNRQILEFSKEKDFIGGDSQVAAVLSKLSQIELQLEEARTNKVSLRQQLSTLDEQIRHQSPLELSIRTAKDELASLRSTYTDENPLVQAKLENIEYLQRQIDALGDGQDVGLDAYTGTPLGNQLYLDIVDVENRLSEATSRIVSLEALQKSTSARLAEFPEIISKYDALRKKRDSFIEGLTLMSNRLKEAQIFATGSPGYWQIFQPPDPRAVVPSSMLKKPLLLGGAGSLAGAGIAMIFTLLLTQRSTRRSVLECCATTRAPLVARLPETAGPEEFRDLWISILSPELAERGPVLFWTSALDAATEREFWRSVAVAVSADAGKPLDVLDLTPDDLWETPAGPELAWTDQGAPSSHHFLRAAGLPRQDRRPSLAEAGSWFAVIEGEKESLSAYAEARHLTEVYLGPCAGTIALIEAPAGLIRRAADELSLFLTQRFS